MRHPPACTEQGEARAFAQPLGGALRYGCSVTDPCIGREATVDGVPHARNRRLVRADRLWLARAGRLHFSHTTESCRLLPLTP